MNTNYSNEKLVSRKNAQKNMSSSFKLRILLLLVALLGTSGIMNAQTIQIGSGTTTTSYLPMYTLYGYSYSQQIYLASEILAAGATGVNNQITKIRFKPTNTVTMVQSQDWVVYLGNTTKTTFSSTTDWIAVASMTQVFNASINLPSTTADTWIELTLTTPFNWDGVSNLVVAVDENTPSYNSTVQWAAFPAASRGIYYYSDGTNPDPLTPPTANSVPSSIAQIQFDGAFQTPCTGTPTVGVVTIPDSICAGVDFDIQVANIAQSGITYQWQSSVAGAGTWTDIVGATSPSYNMANGIMAATDFRVIVGCSNSSLSDTSTLTTVAMNPPLECYCIPTYDYGCGSDNIDDVILAGDSTVGINNLNTPCALAYYSDYTNLSASLTAGNNYSGNVTTTYSGAYENVRIWIDYNRNGLFEASETIATITDMSIDSSGAFSFTVPTLIPNGAYRMRVRLVYGSTPTSIDPCDIESFGEAHDYTVVVTGGCTDPIVDLGGDTGICDGDTLILNAGNSGLDFLWSDNSTDSTLAVTAAGIYTVTVSEGGCATTESVEVNIIGLPTADSIVFTVQNECEFAFSVNGAANVTDYNWDFGDGTSTENGAAVTHTYTTNSPFLVTLVVKNECGDSATITKTVQCSGVGISDVNLDKNALKLYPNPSSDYITIENSSNLKMEYITVFNILGQIVYQDIPQSATKHQMNVSKLSAGLYTVQIKTEQGIITRKFEVLK